MPNPDLVRPDLFGRVRMGYVLVESMKLEAWQAFARDSLGVHVDMPDADTVALRVDDRARRIVVSRGPAEDLTAIGWQVDDEGVLDVARHRLRQRGAELQPGNAEEAARRGVRAFWRVVGPKRISVELFVEPLCTHSPLVMKSSGFVTGASGLGHVAITTREPEAMLAFWREVFDARISDQIEDRIDGMDLEFAFLRLNERHHSIATASTRKLRMDPLRTRIHHLNLQAASLEDVTQAYLRCRATGCELANSIGQHPNDKELSFYVVSPSGFEIELGWNPIHVTEEGWVPRTYRGISLWGHRPENLTLPSRLRRVGRGLSSLIGREYVVPGGRS